MDSDAFTDLGGFDMWRYLSESTWKLAYSDIRHGCISRGRRKITPTARSIVLGVHWRPRVGLAILGGSCCYRSFRWMFQRGFRDGDTRGRECGEYSLYRCNFAISYISIPPPRWTYIVSVCRMNLYAKFIFRYADVISCLGRRC